jgi:hypothetical protein
MIINGRRQSKPITGYYEYWPQIRHRVNIAPHEERNTDESTMKPASNTADHTSLTTTTATSMENTTRAIASSSPTVDQTNTSSTNTNEQDPRNWSSIDVQIWIDEQCQKFELKTTTSDTFQMNGRLNSYAHHRARRYARLLPLLRSSSCSID